MWIDTHCHLFAKPFNQDREEVLQRAREAGVEKFVMVGFNRWANREALSLAEQYGDMWATLGVHPCDCEELDEDEFAWIREEARQNPKVVAIGEMGMDYHHMSYPKEVQEECFRKQIRLAKELDLPCVVHSRDAADDTLNVLLDEGAEKVIFHCYSYDLEFGKKVWEAGYYTSFSGVLTYPHAVEVHAAGKGAPADLILIETDCPYLAPQSKRGKRNETAYMPEVAQKLADLRGVKLVDLAQQLKENTARIFGI